MSQIEDRGYREPETPELMTKRQAAEYLQVSLPTIDNYLRRGLLPAYKLPGGRLVRIKRSDLLGLLREVSW